MHEARSGTRGIRWIPFEIEAAIAAPTDQALATDDVHVPGPSGRGRDRRVTSVDPQVPRPDPDEPFASVLAGGTDVKAGAVVLEGWVEERASREPTVYPGIPT